MILKIKEKKANAVVVSLLTTILVVVIIFSISSIYINKMYSLKNIDSYYDKKIIDLVAKERK